MQSENLVIRRGEVSCRACNAKLKKIIDFGQVPIANELPDSQLKDYETFPLIFSICKECGLGQVGEPITRERLFEDYRYLSSVSKFWLNHAKEFAIETIKKVKLDSKSLVVEIASNDGYLLQYFKSANIQVLGIEPATNVYEIAIKNEIPTENIFFGVDSAKMIKSKYQQPRLIIANNVAAHVPNIRDFFEGLAELSSQETIVSIENPSILNLLLEGQFDTIYHEHFSYLSAFSISKLARAFNLNLFNVESIATHGGSNRYWFKKSKPTELELHQVTNFIEYELASGLLDLESWNEFEKVTKQRVDSIHNWFMEMKSEGRKVIGFAAAAKTSTIINTAKIDETMLHAIIDSSEQKQERFLPIYNIPIVSITNALKMNPTDIVVFAWNISSEITQILHKNFGNQIRIWKLIPTIQEIK